MKKWVLRVGLVLFCASLLVASWYTISTASDATAAPPPSTSYQPYG